VITTISAASPRPEDLIRECKWLCDEAARMRADAIRGRIRAAHTFCSVVESKWVSANESREILAMLRERISDIDSFLREPGHVSMASADELRKLLTHLEARIRHIEKSIQPER
jgi:hypothetical protein